MHINVKTANIFVMIHNFPIFVPAVHKSDDAISEPLSYGKFIAHDYYYKGEEKKRKRKWFGNSVIPGMDSKNKNGEIMNHNHAQ